MTLRLKIRALAITLLLVYTVARFFIVRSVLEGYGVNAWVFLIIDALTAIVYVIGIEQLVLAVVRKEKASGRWPLLFFWGLLTIGAFAAPYAYIYSVSRELPISLGIGIGVVILLLSLNAIIALVRKIRTTK
jgi:hypothetical protein